MWCDENGGARMNVGDLVRLQNCMLQGQTGVVVVVTERSLLARHQPGLALYWVATTVGERCFTGNQLEVINAA
jgi:hypothetical protein